MYLNISPSDPLFYNHLIIKTIDNNKNYQPKKTYV